VRFFGVGLTDGIAEHQIEAVVVRVTSVARTVADCLNFRSKIGLDLARVARRSSHARSLARSCCAA
jgi:predicted transcriptional regulator of viral defense system